MMQSKEISDIENNLIDDDIMHWLETADEINLMRARLFWNSTTSKNIMKSIGRVCNDESKKRVKEQFDRFFNQVEMEKNFKDKQDVEEKISAWRCDGTHVLVHVHFAKEKTKLIYTSGELAIALLCCHNKIAYMGMTNTQLQKWLKDEIIIYKTKNCTIWHIEETFIPLPDIHLKDIP